MISVNRFVVTLALLLGLVAGLSRLRPDRLAEAGLEWWKLPDLLREEEEARQRRAELDQLGHTIRQRVEGKERLFAELLAGRKTLLQTAAGFKRVTECFPGPGAEPVAFPGATVEEKYCRQVIRWVQMQNAAVSTSYVEGLVEQLEQELAENLARPGGLTLPRDGDQGTPDRQAYCSPSP